MSFKQIIDPATQKLYASLLPSSGAPEEETPTSGGITNYVYTGTTASAQATVNTASPWNFIYTFPPIPQAVSSLTGDTLVFRIQEMTLNAGTIQNTSTFPQLALNSQYTLRFYNNAGTFIGSAIGSPSFYDKATNESPYIPASTTVDLSVSPISLISSSSVNNIVIGAMLPSLPSGWYFTLDIRATSSRIVTTPIGLYLNNITMSVVKGDVVSINL